MLYAPLLLLGAFALTYFAELRSGAGPETKVNTVVSRTNHQEDLSATIRLLRPHKWKIFQTLPVYGTRGAVTTGQFHGFLARHRAFSDIIVSEDNDEMTASYVMIDPLGRFFWRDPAGGPGYSYSAPILEVGARAAFRQVVIAWDRYERRYARDHGR